MIIEKLNEAYAAQAKKDAGDAMQGRFPRPSGLGGCLREMAWLLTGLEPHPRSAESMRVVELGHQRGEALERIAKACWPDAEVQVPLRIPWQGGFMEGTCDLWLPSQRTIVDFKTAGSYAMGLLLGGTERGADEGYALQLNAYRHGIVEIERRDDYPCSLGEIRTVLVYEAKDSDARKGIKGGMLVEQEVPWSPELEERYQARLTAIDALLRAHETTGVLPTEVPGMPRDSRGQPHWKCRMKDGAPLYCSVGTIRGQCH